MGNDTKAPKEGWPLLSVWKEYEGIAMHFNDLLMKLRTQALGGVAAVSALVGIFGKTGQDETTNWKMATVVFCFLIAFWIAIWIIDFLYYNRLLLGSVRAIMDLEQASENNVRIKHIDISTKIEAAVAGELGVSNDRCRDFRLSLGRWIFYVVVLLALLGGATFSAYEWNMGDSSSRFGAVPPNP